MAIIVLDPGHGGETNLVGSSANNAAGPAGTLEKHLTLDVAQRLCRLLVAQGHSVHMTRTSDVNISALDRAQLARTVGAAVFLSIHFNGFRDPAVQGTETLVRPIGGNDLAHVDALSRTLAQDVQAGLVAALRHRDRGLKPGQWAVLTDQVHGANTARCLAEISFLTDPAEEQRLADTAYRDRIAGAIAHALENNLALRFGGAARPRLAVGAAWPIEQRSHDPDAYGRPRLYALGGNGDEEGEGTENDAGDPIAVVYSTGTQTESHCPAAPQATAGTAHFALAEFRCRDGTDCPERFRGYLQQLMENLEVLRTELGNRPININSGYRTPSYNERIGGAPRSKHMCGMAADFTVEGHDLQTVYDTIERLIAAGSMRQGGLSKYRTFIHYDVRGTRARWSGG